MFSLASFPSLISSPIYLQAGIPKRQLIIALEPECAAVYFKSSLEMKKVNLDMNKAGFKYMVLDNGGLLN